MLELASPVTNIPAVGQVTLAKLKKLNINTCEDLLWHLPYKYDDFSHITPIDQIPVNAKVTVRGKIRLIQSRRSYKRRLNITEALVGDATGTVKCIWFNQPYLSKQLKIGQEILLAGVLKPSNYGWQLDNPTYEPVSGARLHTARLVPNYHLTGGLTSRLVRRLVYAAMPTVNTMPDWLPRSVLKKYSLLNLSTALKLVHFPTKTEDIKSARYRLAFDELLLLRLTALAAKKDYALKPAPVIPFSARTKQFVSNLPWTLTDDQKKSAWKIINDLAGAKPMNRLLQGDVGAGKTVVAGIAALNVIDAGFKVALLAPTEILAAQHFATLKKLFNNFPITIALFTRSQKNISQSDKVSKKNIVDDLAKGKINFIVGTHALLTDNVAVPNLGLLIIDEQHRFGVEQRNWLIKKSVTTPHLLSLSATPIPRSLALTIYGDLDISLIKELPKGRRPIKTEIVSEAGRAKAYQLIRTEVLADHRVFIICPLIAEGDTLGEKSVQEEKLRLEKNIFPDIAIGVLHGRMTGKEKNQALQNFAQGQTPILVSTTVVEVGIDVPNATVMAIEGAQNFGLAQLHQLRGRVGRSELPSYCLLMADGQDQDNEAATGLWFDFAHHPELVEGRLWYPPLLRRNPPKHHPALPLRVIHRSHSSTALPPWHLAKADKRLEALVKYQNGFDLAEQDLSQRGPGDLLGTSQSGWLPLKVASLANTGLIEIVRDAAGDILKTNPDFLTEPHVKKILKIGQFHPE